jgi:mycofactocin precursor
MQDAQRAAENESQPGAVAVADVEAPVDEEEVELEDDITLDELLIREITIDGMCGVY